jgi:hypothetical protein
MSRNGKVKNNESRRKSVSLNEFEENNTMEMYKAAIRHLVEADTVIGELNKELKVARYVIAYYAKKYDVYDQDHDEAKDTYFDSTDQLFYKGAKAKAYMDSLNDKV